jgi:hypothetical protein
MGKLWHWEAIAIGCPAIYGAGIAAMYGDDYLVAAALYLVGIGWLTAKIFTSEEAKIHKKKAGIRLLVVMTSLMLIATSLLWILHRQQQHRAELS